MNLESQGDLQLPKRRGFSEAAARLEVGIFPSGDGTDAEAMVGRLDGATRAMAKAAAADAEPNERVAIKQQNRISGGIAPRDRRAPP